MKKIPEYTWQRGWVLSFDTNTVDPGDSQVIYFFDELMMHWGGRERETSSKESPKSLALQLISACIYVCLYMCVSVGHMYMCVFVLGVTQSMSSCT